MRNICFLLVTATIFQAFANANNLILNKEELNDPNSKGLFFDPHNHKGGELPPLALVNQKKYIYGEELSLKELKNFWAGIANFYSLDDQLKYADRVANGTKMFLNCNEAMETCSNLASDDLCKNELVKSINQVLSATPLTSFNTAYAMRTKLLDIEDIIPKFGDWSSSTDRRHAFLYAIAKTKVDLVEMTKVFMFSKNDEKGTKDFRCYAELNSDLKSQDPSKENKKFLQRLKSQGLAVPKIKWLLMTHTLQLGMTSPSKTITYDKGQCQEIDMPAVNTDPMDGIYDVLVDYKDVVGVDVAGPESTCFTEYGMNEFKKLTLAVYKASKERHKRYGLQGKLVVRTHVGEGFPTEQRDFHADKFNACMAIQNFSPIKMVHDRNQNTPVHIIEARKNISFLLDAIEDLKKEYLDINDFVVFRLGHATHIDDALSKKAKSLGISADVNLSSNLATGAWPVPPSIITKYLVQNGVTPNNIQSLLKALIDNGARLGDIFDGHGLMWLLHHDVPVTLGSDGGGVEHSNSIRDEYLMAQELINFWSARDKNFASKNISIDNILKSQQAHYKDMAYELDENISIPTKPCVLQNTDESNEQIFY